MKPSTPKARTVRRFWSLLLSLVMALALLPTAALADGGEVTGAFKLMAKVEKDGVAIPSPETFTFEITDRVDAPETPKDLSEYGITVPDLLEVKLTDFESEANPSTIIHIKLDTTKISAENGWTKETGAGGSPDYFKKYLTLRQTSEAKHGWLYDQREMVMRIAYYLAGKALPTDREKLRDAGMAVFR